MQYVRTHSRFGVNLQMSLFKPVHFTLKKRQRNPPIEVIRQHWLFDHFSQRGIILILFRL
jgi:hypothetical protein